MAMPMAMNLLGLPRLAICGLGQCLNNVIKVFNLGSDHHQADISGCFGDHLEWLPHVGGAI
jgi:hypothetical protein